MKIFLKKLKMYIRDIYYLFNKIRLTLFNYSSEVYSFYVHPSVKIGKNVIIRKYCNIAKNVIIGDYTFINEYTRIDSSIESIGKYCSISHNVKLGMIPHPLDLISTSPVFYSKNRGLNNEFVQYDKKSKIGNDVFIASNVIVLYDVNIGDGAVIAAGSVVTKDVAPYAIMGGVPAKLIKYRFSKDEITKLLNIKWWDKDLDSLLRHNYMQNKVMFFENMDNPIEK